MANVNDKLPNWYEVADAELDLEFERIKAERLARGQGRLLADLTLDEEFDVWKQMRLEQMQAGRVSAGPPLVPPSRLLWLAVMLAAIAVAIWKLGWGR